MNFFKKSTIVIWQGPVRLRKKIVFVSDFPAHHVQKGSTLNITAGRSPTFQDLGTKNMKLQFFYQLFFYSSFFLFQESNDHGLR